MTEEYKTFFSYINGVVLYVIDIFGIYDPTESYQNENLYLQALESSDYAEIIEKQGQFILGEENYGDLYLLEMKTGNILWWAHEEDCFRKKWKTLAGFLKEKLR
ncbi:SMI1/KNR4 family protein [Bacillus haynesii]|nr:SMI1/KNR4 family protein [Bacillus haynesii]MCY9178992.1 SMI1/KNR4 family protein [Bacillus haynesii]